MEGITIGDNSNVQDNCTLHTGNGFALTIGNGVTIGHNAIVHGCTVGDNTVIGMGSILLNGAKVGKNCIIGAGTVLIKDVPDNSVAVGVPGKIIKSTLQQ
jgi:carbonic anhydrase/acetyltransferase-like protein (isoleucine patch superfamily)